MARPSCPRGTQDLLPADIPPLEHLFRACREELGRHGYREIRTPMFEDTSLFVRSLGEVTDVVEKEMFTITRGDTSLTFRPEGTAPVVRAYLQHNLDKTRPFQKLYYLGPMFRFERPQAGRSRQFDQVGIEAIGSSSPHLDAEVVLLAHRCFAAAGLENYRIHCNSIGDRGDRDTFRAVLREHMAAHLDERCDDCRQRFERNVFRMLDCKVEGCRASNATAPRFLDHLGPESRGRFDHTMALLDELEVPCTVDPAIVRGFDYYTHIVFEVRCPDLGARDAVCGGGRYDDLVHDMGGPDVGAIGFAIGVTPTLLALEIQKHPAMAGGEEAVPVLVVPVDDSCRDAAFLLTNRLRAQGLTADTDYESKSLRALFKAAPRRGVRLMLILGPDEVAGGTVQVRDLERREDETLADDDRLTAALRQRLAP